VDIKTNLINLSDYNSGSDSNSKTKSNTSSESEPESEPESDPDDGFNQDDVLVRGDRFY
jgi:hypothetical protein